MDAGGLKQVQCKEYICWIQVKIHISDQTSLRICNSALPFMLHVPSLFHDSCTISLSCNLSLSPLLVIHVHSPLHDSCTLSLSWFLYSLPFMIHLPSPFHDSCTLSLSWFMYPLPFMIHLTSAFHDSWTQYSLEAISKWEANWNESSRVIGLGSLA